MSRYGLRPHRAADPGRERGQSLVELAIVLPVLLALVVGIFEFGRAWNVYQVITNAAREGARLAVIPTSSESVVRTAIEDALQRAALDPAAGSISVSGMGSGTGTPTTLQIDYPYEFAFLGPVVDLLGAGGEAPGSITLSTTIVMRNE